MAQKKEQQRSLRGRTSKQEDVVRKHTEQLKREESPARSPLASAPRSLAVSVREDDEAAALSAAALFTEITLVVAFVIWVVVAAFELLKARLSSALSAAAFCYELALVGASVILVVASAAALQAFAEFFEAQRPHNASQAEATPRVDVGEVSQISGERAARSFKVQNSCTEGGSNKGCFFVTDLTGKTLTMTTPLDSSASSLPHDIATVTCIPVERFYFVVAGRVLSLDSTLSQVGIGWNVSVRMCFRVNRGARHDVPGSSTCMVCNMGGCWPVQHCFRCGSARGTGPSIPAGRDVRYPGKGSGGPVNNGNPTTADAEAENGGPATFSSIGFASAHSSEAGFSYSAAGVAVVGTGSRSLDPSGG